MVKTKYFNLTNYAVGSGNVLIRKQIEDRQVNDKYLAFCKFCYEVLGYNFEHPKFVYLGCPLITGYPAADSKWSY